MTDAMFDQNGMAIAAMDITVFNYDGDTREYLFSAVEHLAMGVGLPANSCIDAPGDSKKGFAICRSADLTAWEYVKDCRGERVFSTETGEEIIISAPGDYPENTTTSEPLTRYDKWNGKAWGMDADAQRADEVAAAEKEKSTRLEYAHRLIALEQTKLLMGRKLTVSETEKLAFWIDYIDAVTVTDTSDAPDIKWPPQPE